MFAGAGAGAEEGSLAGSAEVLAVEVEGELWDWELDGPSAREGEPGTRVRAWTR